MPSDFAVSRQLLRPARGQVACQRHLSHLQAGDSPMNNSERNNHGLFFSAQGSVSNKHPLNLVRLVGYRINNFKIIVHSMHAGRHHPVILHTAKGKKQPAGPTLSQIR